MTQNASPLDFIRQIVTDDLASDKHGGRVATRFPPEPNGYLHIGHAKSICLNFGVAREFAGQCNLRFDDTNPLREDDEFVDAIQQDVQWLGFEWAGEVKNASDYFEQLYDYAETLISSGLAYVCDLSAEQIREYRGTLTTPGRDSPYRDRSVEENLALFRRMRAGEFKDGSRVLRAKIDMASPNVNMRDPTLYRIRHVSHQRTADAWCIYPMYDYTHCLSDAIEGVTHSLCTLEFADHRPLYDWILDVLPTPCHPQQIEFSRLNLEYTVMSKRLLNLLVTQNYVSGWDDPRMPTISGLRRRGFTAASIREFCARIGVTKKDNVIEMGVLENVVREDLDREAPRAMAVLDPIKLVVDNYPDDLVEEMEAVNHPNRPELGVRTVPFSRELWIERSDFLVNPPKKFHRLGPGREVRLRYGYVVQYASHVENDDGEVTEIHCTYDPQTRGGNTPDGRKVRGTIHWVSAEHAAQAEVRLYDRLFSVPSPGAAVANDSSEAALNEILNPQSLVTVNAAMVEPGLRALEAEARVQFERQGYFCIDRFDSSPERLVFNRTVTLRDSWAKLEKEQKSKSA